MFKKLLLNQFFRQLQLPINPLSNYIVYLHINLSFSAGIIASGFTYHLGYKASLLYGFFAFFATMAVYNFHALYKHSANIDSTKNKWMQTHLSTVQSSIAVGGISAILFVLWFLKNPIKMLPFLVFITLISFFYVVPIRGKALREQAFMKIIYVALVWTSILLVIPQLNENANPIEWLDISAFFCLFFAVAIPFDLRDSEIDSQKMNTIPTYFGVKKSKIIALFAFGCSVTLLLIKHLNWLENPIFWLAISLNGLLLITAAGSKKEEYYAFIDSAFGIFGLIYFW